MFEAGSALCGGAPSMNALIVGRVWAGVGGAGMYLGGLNYFSRFTSLRERSMYTSLIGVAWGLGTILGPVIGGAFAISSATWRWAFYINLCVAAVCAPAFYFYLPTHDPKPETSFGTKLGSIDWLGAILIAAVYILFVTAFAFGGIEWAWDDHRFIVLIIVLGVAAITLVVTQYFAIFTTPDRQIFPGKLLRRQTLLLLYFGTAATATGLFIGTYYIPLFFQFARNDTAIMAAVRLLPFICVAIVSIMINGTLLPVLGYYMPWYAISGIFMIIGGSLMHTVELDTSPSKIYGYSALMAIGAGSALQSGYAIAAAKVAPDDVAAGISFINVAQLGSIVIALTISGAVFQNVGLSNLRAVLADKGFSDAEIAGAIAGTQSAVFEQGDEQVKIAALTAIIQAMDKVFILVVVAGAVSLLSSLLMRREKLSFKAGIAG